MQKGLQFLELPLSHRRVVFLDAFRNAYHDLAGRSCSAQSVVVTALPQFPQRTASHRTPAGSEGMELQTKLSSVASSATSEAPKSRLAQAILEAQATTPTKTPAEAAPPAEPNSKNVLLLDSPIFFEEEKSAVPAEAIA